MKHEPSEEDLETSEEAGCFSVTQKLYYIECRECGQESSPEEGFFSAKEAIEQALDQDFAFVAGRWLCPACSKKTKRNQ